jgi:hypothetical protein
MVQGQPKKKCEDPIWKTNQTRTWGPELKPQYCHLCLSFSLSLHIYIMNSSDSWGYEATGSQKSKVPPRIQDVNSGSLLAQLWNSDAPCHPIREKNPATISNNLHKSDFELTWQHRCIWEPPTQKKLALTGSA